MKCAVKITNLKAQPPVTQILLTRAQVRIMVIWYLWIKNDSKTGCFSLILDGWTNHVTKLAVKMVYHSKMDWPSTKLAIRLTI